MNVELQYYKDDDTTHRELFCSRVEINTYGYKQHNKALKYDIFTGVESPDWPGLEFYFRLDERSISSGDFVEHLFCYLEDLDWGMFKDIEVT